MLRRRGDRAQGPEATCERPLASLLRALRTSGPQHDVDVTLGSGQTIACEACFECECACAITGPPIAASATVATRAVNGESRPPSGASYSPSAPRVELSASGSGSASSPSPSVARSPCPQL